MLQSKPVGLCRYGTTFQLGPGNEDVEERLAASGAKFSVQYSAIANLSGVTVRCQPPTKEAWSHIRNAKLELFDAADDGGKPVCVVEYKDGKIVGMDPATRAAIAIALLE